MIRIRPVVFVCLAYIVGGSPSVRAGDVANLGVSGWSLWLDRDAPWRSDRLYLPPVKLQELPVHEPSCGWSRLFAQTLPADRAREIVTNPALSMRVEVPGTVEGYCWDALSRDGKGLGRSGDYVGVSWWGRDFDVPASARGKRIKLNFTEGVRQRAEVFVNEKLVGYEIVHQSAFEVDVTDYVTIGSSNKLAVRITDANGNFSWVDYLGELWGDYFFPLSHGFGGILGPVRLEVVEPVHVADIFVKNKPTLTDVDVDVEVSNEGDQALSGTVEFAVVENWASNKPVAQPRVVYTGKAGRFSVQPGQSSTITASLSVPDARLWDIRDANLYDMVVTLKGADGGVLDTRRQRFGFRFFSVSGYGTNAEFRLNGKRHFLLSSISWGFWPINGIFPTPELARKHMESAFALGQNMLNFHRCQGNNLVLDLADEMGMLYYEEPGSYGSHRFKPGNVNAAKAKEFQLAVDLNSQRWLRLVKAHRNHPSLVMYNMVNEPGLDPDDQAKIDMAAAHRIDPTRFYSYGSGFMSIGAEQAKKLHMLPYDNRQYTRGYVDIHHAGNSPGVYVDAMYNSPQKFRRDEAPRDEIFVWGEEGAIASPPQLELIQEDIERAGRTGWDGSDYRDWYAVYTAYIRDKGLEKYYPSLTGLITSLGNIMYYEHGRLLENTRIADAADLYVLNGYEDMKFDNFSGSVDIFRNLKGDPGLISRYMAPLLVAVKVRDKVGQVGDVPKVDLFVLNEHAIAAGDYVVKALVEYPDGRTQIIHSGPVKVTGGDVFSDLAASDIAVPLDSGPGYYKIKAVLRDAADKTLAQGHDEIFAVDWQSDRIPGKGAVYAGEKELLRFARDIKKADVVPYADNLGKLDYVVLGARERGDAYVDVSPFNFRATDGRSLGLNMDLFRGRNFEERLDRRLSTARINFDGKSNLIPGYDIMGDTDFSVRWQGAVVSDVTGPVSFQIRNDDGARVWLDGKLVVDSWTNGPARTATFDVNLEAGKAYAIKIEAFQAGGDWAFSFKWKLPADDTPFDLDKLLARVRDDGTRLVIAADAENWVKELQQRGAFPAARVFHPSRAWVGHNFFVREHPFFEGLPVNGGMNWEYQRLVVYDGPKHFGLYDMKGEDAIVSLVGGASHIVSTSVGIVPYGNGRIVFSSLDLAPNLMLDEKASAVPRKIYCNYLRWSGAR